MHADQTTNRLGALPAQDLPLIIFGLGSQRYGLEIHAIIEIVRLPALTPLHAAPPTVAGLLNWHGHFLPVFDGRALVGQPSYCDLSSQILLLGAPGATAALKPQLGLLVDAVYALQTIGSSDLSFLPPEAGARLLPAVCHGHGDTSVLLFDSAVLLSAAPTLRSSSEVGH